MDPRKETTEPELVVDENAPPAPLFVAPVRTIESPNRKQGDTVLIVMVTDARRMFEEGGKVKHLSFWAYQILTQISLPAYMHPPMFPVYAKDRKPNYQVKEGFTEYMTWHRYSDIEWLLTHLQAEFPGYIFPPIPEKEAAGTKDKLKDLFTTSQEVDTLQINKFVQKRKKWLELFAEHLSTTPDFFESTHVKAFLTMGEVEWLAYKEEIARQQKKGWSFSGMFSGPDKKMCVFDEVSTLGRVRMMQKRFSEALADCMKQCINIISIAMTEMPLQSSDGIVNLAGKKIPPTLVYNGHFVADLQHTSGVVRHVEGLWAWVHWTDSPDELSKVPVDSLIYPNSGTVDPAIFSFQEIVMVIESYIAFICNRKEAQELSDLVDYLWFWNQYSQSVMGTVSRLEDIVRERIFAEDQAKKEKKQDKKDEWMKKENEASRKFDHNNEKFMQIFAFHFRPMQQRAMHKIAKWFGDLTSTMLCDDEWENRLQRADNALPLMFDVPEQVLAPPTVSPDPPTATSPHTLQPPGGGGDNNSAPNSARKGPSKTSRFKPQVDPFAVEDAPQPSPHSTPRAGGQSPVQQVKDGPPEYTPNYRDPLGKWDVSPSSQQKFTEEGTARERKMSSRSGSAVDNLDDGVRQRSLTPRVSPRPAAEDLPPSVSSNADHSV